MNEIQEEARPAIKAISLKPRMRMRMKLGLIIRKYKQDN